jgi:hypothetical protein
LLDVDRALALKVDGPPGFYLASDVGDAEFFAARRDQGAVICFEVSADAFDELVRAGARYQPVTNFSSRRPPSPCTTGS